MLPIEILSIIFLAGGAFFMITGTVGLYKFPDFYTRMHATGKCDTVGQVFIIVGCMIYAGWSYITIKLLLVSFFYLFAGPAGTHALMKAGYVNGVKVWHKGDPRDPEE
jgi:multicomponent Na+:H+ antiporter subunit G